MASNYESRKRALERRRALTEALMEKSQVQQPVGQMIGPHFLGAGPLQAFAPIVQALTGALVGKGLDRKEADLETQRQQEIAAAMQGIQDKVKSGDQSWMYDPAVLGDKTLSGYATAAFKEQVKPRELKEYQGQLYNPVTGELGSKLPSQRKLAAHRGAIYDPETGEVIREGVGYAPASTNVSVTNIAPTGEKAFAKKLGEEQGMDVANARRMKLDAVNTTRMLTRLEELNANPVYSGPQAKPFMWIGEAAAGFGIPLDPERLANSEAYQQTIGESIARKVLEGGRGISNEDRLFIEKSYPSLMLSPQGRQMVIQHMRYVAQQQAEQADLIEQSIQGNMPELERLIQTNPSGLVNPAKGNGVAPGPGPGPVAPGVPTPTKGKIRILRVQ